jgi:hypothetical protein
VTYDGSTITKFKTGTGTVTYYKTVVKLADGGYASRVHVTAN